MDTRLKNLDRAFCPRSIAFVGATETLTKWGFLILNNLLTGGYRGKIYPVNPKREAVLGLKAYPRVLDIPEDVDLAVFTVPSRQVLEAIEDCAAKKVKAALVITAGFRETGEEGAALEAALVKKARDAGMLLIGPNCQGICCPRSNLYPWMPILFHPPRGSVGFVSQSGNILNMLIGHVVSSGLGVSKAVSSGNEADLRTVDYLSYLAEDDDTEVIAAYVEGINDGREFVERAREATRLKPVVVLKGGRTSSGISAARSHTGAMAVSETIFEAACRQAGVIVTRSIEECGVTAASFVNRPLPKGRRIGIVTGGGGLGVIASDFCTEIGLEVAELSPGVLSRLESLLPDWWVPGNPVDLVAGLDFTVIRPVLETLMTSGEVDAVLFLWIGAPRNENQALKVERGMDISRVWDLMDRHFLEYSREPYDMMHRLGVPLYIATTLRPEQGGERESDRRPLIFGSVESACRAVSAMAEYRAYLESSAGGKA